MPDIEFVFGMSAVWSTDEKLLDNFPWLSAPADVLLLLQSGRGIIELPILHSFTLESVFRYEFSLQCCVRFL